MDFADIYRRYRKNIFRYIYERVRGQHRAKQLAEDLTQDTFCKAYEKRDQLRNPNAITSWLFSIARNTVTSYYRKATTRRTVIAENLEGFAPEPGPEQSAFSKEDYNVMHQEIRQLNPREREILGLKFWQLWTNREVAYALGCTETNVRAIQSRALKKVRARCHI